MYRNLYTNKWAISNQFCVLHYSGRQCVDDVRPVQLSTFNTALHKHCKVWLCDCVIIVYCTLCSVCNTDVSDVCAVKITYLVLLFKVVMLHRPVKLCGLSVFCRQSENAVWLTLFQLVHMFWLCQNGIFTNSEACWMCDFSLKL